MNEMSEAAKMARREYNRKWAAEHKEQRKAARVRYWEKKAEKTKKEGKNDE